MALSLFRRQARLAGQQTAKTTASPGLETPRSLNSARWKPQAAPEGVPFWRPRRPRTEVGGLSLGLGF